jgi:glyoxylase-like metal-dependent hydrolase (beta-lactamase superfamily II)/8-oxo-dGTP pyrophosphatase MutT (NUDIX family)
VKAIPLAASVLLAQQPEKPTLFLVRRAESLRFFGGFHAFAGGKVHAADAELAGLFCPSEAPTPAQELVRIVAAARELFEETGVLIARDSENRFPHSSPQLTHYRKELLEDRLSFRQLLANLGLELSQADFTFVANLVTPAFTTVRFDTHFYLAFAPPGQQAEVWAGELDQGYWTTATALLDEWRKGLCLVSPPTVAMLHAVRGLPARGMAQALQAALAPLANGRIHPIYFAPAVQMIPLRTEALPPSTHTNAYLVGRDHAYLLDPGASDPQEQERLFEVLDDLPDQGIRLEAIVLSHQHPDHTGAAGACSKRYGIPIRAHALTARSLAGKVAVRGDIEAGDQLELGTAPDGQAGWHLQAIHTPGHASGHLVFYDPYYRLLFAGDMVSTLSSVVIAPPEGDLTLYLQSLRRLRDLKARLLLPSHGSVSARPVQTIDEALAHRAKREHALLHALMDEPRPISELVKELYRGVPHELHRLAKCQVLAGLRKLQSEGRAQPVGQETDETWTLTSREALN